MRKSDYRFWLIVWIICSLFQLNEAPPTVVITQSSYTVTTGVSVTLQCTVTPYSSNAPVTKVYWKIDDVSNTLTIDSNTNTAKYSGSTTSTPSLTILSVALSDAGSYQCAEDSFFTGYSSLATLHVLSTPPTVIITQSSYTVSIGVSVTLHCTVTPSFAPISNVYWKRSFGSNTVIINSNTNTAKYIGSTITTPSLTILNAVLSDAGSYLCSAEDSYSFTGYSSPTTLIVLSTPPSVITTQSSYTINTGVSVTLQCIVTPYSSFSPITKVVWQRIDGVSALMIPSTTNTTKYSGSTTSRPSLTILNAALSDAGIYQCCAEDSYSYTGYSSPTTLIVLLKPPSVIITQSSYTVITGVLVTLQCTVTPYASYAPILKVYWKKSVGNYTLTINSTTNTTQYSGSTTITPSLTILNAALSDAGSYQCCAEDSYLYTGYSSPTTLIVLFTPPTVIITQSSYTVTTGAPVTLQCAVTPYLTFASITKVYWQKIAGGNALTISSTTNTTKYSGSTKITPSLTIFGTALSDAGLYQCCAEDSNLYTGYSSATTLIVLSTPPIVSIHQSSYTVTIGASVTLHCTVTASFAAITKVYWLGSTGSNTLTITSTTNTTKYNGSTTITPSVTILIAALSDVGSYQCCAEDIYFFTGCSTPTTLSVLYNASVITGNTASIVAARQSDNISLVCDADVNSTITSVFWTKTINGTKFDITDNRQGGTISSKDLLLPDIKWTDAGLYTCYIGTNFGNITGKSIDLNIITGSPMCPCTVNYLKKLMFWESQILSNITREELRIILEPVLNELRQALRINRKNVSSSYRRLNSAYNQRESEKRIGYIGATILAIVFGLIVAVDLFGRTLCTKFNII